MRLLFERAADLCYLAPMVQKELSERDEALVRAALNRLDRSIVLVGLMGAGKSSVGKRLATWMGLPFEDADDAIEEAAGCTIPEIFARYGEPAFRDGERKVIARLMEGPIKVLATGGGAFIDPTTRALIKEKGLSIWLKADLSILVERTGRRDNRPLLQSGDRGEILKKLVDVRYPVYAESDLFVQTGRGAHEDAVRAILKAIISRPAEVS